MIVVQLKNFELLKLFLEAYVCVLKFRVKYAQPLPFLVYEKSSLFKITVKCRMKHCFITFYKMYILLWNISGLKKKNSTKSIKNLIWMCLKSCSCYFSCCCSWLYVCVHVIIITFLNNLAKSGFLWSSKTSLNHFMNVSWNTNCFGISRKQMKVLKRVLAFESFRWIIKIKWCFRGGGQWRVVFDHYWLYKVYYHRISTTAATF